MTEEYLTLTDLAGSLSGRAFIVGNGPSLARTDVTKIKGDHVFGSNRVYLGYDDWGFHFPYWCIEDTRVARDTREEWNEIPASLKFVPYEIKSLVDNWDNVCMVNFIRTGWKRIDGNRVWWPDFSIEPEQVFQGMTVTYMMIQIAFILGCNPLYLIGVDHYYKRTTDLEERPAKLISTGPDPDHFRPDYFGPGRKYHTPRTDLSTNSYRVAELACVEKGLKIYNASKQTALDVFEMVDYDSLF